MADKKDLEPSFLSRLICENLPQDGISMAIGYGSKVIKQASNEIDQGDMIDLILVVDNPFKWHEENFSRNKSHYSFIKYLPNSVSKIVNLQERYGAKVYYNPFVELEDVRIKYGVIKTDHLLDDLNNWTHLYVSGRLHKPIRLLIDTPDPNKSLSSAIRFNRECALRAAMLQLPETFNTINLYKKIAALSYAGDLRMLFGEDKNKVDKIVQGQMESFDQLYLSMIRRKDSVQWNESKQIFTQDLSPQTVLKNLESLPRNVRRTICLQQSEIARSIESQTILSSISKSLYCDKIVAQAISTIVRRSSFTQSLKGVVTAGLSKSIRYSGKKLIKSLKSRMG